MSWYTDRQLFIYGDGTFYVYRIAKEFGVNPIVENDLKEEEVLSFSKHLSLENSKEKDYHDFKGSFPLSGDIRQLINCQGWLINWDRSKKTGTWKREGITTSYWRLPGIPQLKSVSEQDLEEKVPDMEEYISSLQDDLKRDVVNKKAIEKIVLDLETENASIKAQINKEKDEKTNLTDALQRNDKLIAGLEEKVSSLQDDANNNKVEKEALDKKVLKLESESAIQKEQVSIERNDKEVLRKRVLDSEVEAADLKAQVNRDEEDEKSSPTNGLQSTVDMLMAGIEALQQQVKNFESKLVLES